MLDAWSHVLTSAVPCTEHAVVEDGDQDSRRGASKLLESVSRASVSAAGTVRVLSDPSRYAVVLLLELIPRRGRSGLRPEGRICT